MALTIEQVGRMAVRAAPELLTAFNPWRMEVERYRETKSTVPLDISGTAVVSGTPKTDRQANQVYNEFVSGRLQVMDENAVNRLVAGPFAIRAHSVSPDPMEQFKRENLVHVCQHILETWDERVREDHKGIGWRSLVATDAITKGKVTIRVHVGQPDPDDHEAEITCDVIDSLTVAHDFGSFPKRLVRPWVTGAMDARQQIAALNTPDQAPDFAWPGKPEWGEDDGPVTLTEVIIEEKIPNKKRGQDIIVWRAMLVDGALAGVQKMGLTHSEILSIAVNATADSYDLVTPTGATSGQGATGNRGKPYMAILYHAGPMGRSLMYTHRQHSIFISAAFDGAVQGLNASLLIQSPGAKAKPPEGVLDAGGQWAVDENTTVSPVNRGNLAAMQIVDGLEVVFEKEYAMKYDPMLLGGQTGASGYADEKAVSHAAMVLEQPAQGCAFAAQMSLAEAIHQLKQHPELVVRMPDGDYSAKDFPDDTRIVCDWEADLGDLMSKLGAANQMMNVLKLPRSLTYTKALGIPNPREVIDLQRDEMVPDLPGMTGLRALRIGRGEVAVLFAQVTQFKDRKRHAQALYAANLAEADVEQFARTLPGSQNTGSGPKPPGMPPQLLPPQAGPNNPNVMNGAIGNTAVGMGGQGAQGVTSPGNGLTPADGSAPGMPTAPGGQ